MADLLPPHPPRQLRSRRTLERIVRASLQILNEDGPDGLTVQAIVERAGSSVGSFYARFSGKDELLAYLGERIWREAAARWDEAVASRKGAGTYPFSLVRENGLLAVNWKEMVAGLIADAKERVPQGTISRRFHDTLAAAILDAASRLAEASGARHVILSGGVFQNATLLASVLSGLRRKRLVPLIHRQVPANDGGISLGQAYYAALRVAGG